MAGTATRRRIRRRCAMRRGSGAPAQLVPLDSTLNHNWVLRDGAEPGVDPVRQLQERDPAEQSRPLESTPTGSPIGANPDTPQKTEQTKWQFRDDFSWSERQWGLGHDFKTGVNFINEPHLFIDVQQRRRRLLIHPPDRRTQRADSDHHPQRRQSATSTFRSSGTRRTCRTTGGCRAD